ncbi:MAG TPA: hypothetical protein VH951_03365 [Dehalococcoidia bacterium]
MTTNSVPGGGRRREVALVAVKAIHSGIFLVLQTAIAYLAYAGFRGRADRTTAVAALVAGIETAVYVGNGYRCPLTALAEDLGSGHGQVTDIFLPKLLADNIDKIYGPLLALGLCLQARILLNRSRSQGGAAGFPSGSPPPKE